MPFYSGLVMVIRKISVEKEDVNVFKTFVQAFRENLKKSIFNGFVAYLIVACSFFAILYYGTLAQTDIVYGSVFTIYIVFSIAMLIMLFYVPLLTITYDLRLRDIYKNSLLLIFGKILRNIVALVLVVIVSFAVFLAVIYAKGAMLVIAVTLSVIFYPMIATYIIVSVIAKGVQESVGYFTGDNVQYVLTEEEVQRETEAVENANSDDDYIFVNGSESAVKVNLTIRDGEGNLLNEIGDIDVPIVRGKLTTIRDEFLTRDYAPGIGINPGFDGEIDIVIPD